MEPIVNVAMDQFDNRIGRTKHLQVGEAEYLEPIRFEISISDRIFLDSFLSMVLPTIHLDGQLRSRSIEVHYVVPDRPLAVETNGQNLLASKMSPKLSFAVGHQRTEFTRFDGQPSVVLEHGIPPSSPSARRKSASRKGGTSDAAWQVREFQK